MDIICNMDGTIANCDHRLHLIDDKTNPKWDEFFEACSEDLPMDTTIDIVQQLISETNNIIFVTSRPERVREKTMAWMAKAFDEPFGIGVYLMMRKDGDHRPDFIIKQEMLSAMRQLGFKPEVAFEDRKQVVDMYRKEGLTVYHVAEGNY